MGCGGSKTDDNSAFGPENSAFGPDNSAEIFGAWIPTRVEQWNNCPCPLEARLRTYRYDIQASGMKGGRVELTVNDVLYPSHAAMIVSTQHNVWEGWGTNSAPHGNPREFRARFELQANGELHAKWGDGFRTVYYLVRDGDPRASEHSSGGGGGGASTIDKPDAGDLSGKWYSYMRAGDPNHAIDEFELVKVGSKYKIMRHGHNGDRDEFAVHGGRIYHDHGIEASIQPNGDIFWHFEDEQYASRRRKGGTGGGGHPCGAGMEGVWEPTRTEGWQNCPVPEHDRCLYQMTIGADGHWKGGRAGSYIESDNFHGSLTTRTGEGRGHDNTHGDYPCRFKLLDSGELECAFGDYSVVYFFERRSNGKPSPDEADAPPTITLSKTGGPHPHFNDVWTLDKAGMNGRVCYRRRGNAGDLLKWDGARWTVNGTGPYQGENCAYWSTADTPWPPASGWQAHRNWRGGIEVAGGHAGTAGGAGTLQKVDVGRVISWYEARDRAEEMGGRLPTTAELCAANVDVGYDQWTPVTPSPGDHETGRRDGARQEGENAWANIGPRKYQIEYPAWGLDAGTHPWKHLTYFYYTRGGNGGKATAPVIEYLGLWRDEASRTFPPMPKPLPGCKPEEGGKFYWSRDVAASVKQLAARIAAEGQTVGFLGLQCPCGHGVAVFESVGPAEPFKRLGAGGAKGSPTSVQAAGFEGKITEQGGGWTNAVYKITLQSGGAGAPVISGLHIGTYDVYEGAGREKHAARQTMIREPDGTLKYEGDIFRVIDPAARTVTTHGYTGTVNANGEIVWNHGYTSVPDPGSGGGAASGAADVGEWFRLVPQHEPNGNAVCWTSVDVEAHKLKISAADGRAHHGGKQNELTKIRLGPDDTDASLWRKVDVQGEWFRLESKMCPGSTLNVIHAEHRDARLTLWHDHHAHSLFKLENPREGAFTRIVPQHAQECALNVYGAGGHGTDICLWDDRPAHGHFQLVPAGALERAKGGEAGEAAAGGGSNVDVALLSVSGLGADAFANTEYSGASFDGTYAPMGMHEGRPYYGCGNNRLYVSKMGHWCLTNDPSQMHTNQLAQEPAGNVGLRFHPGTNVGLVASGGATGKGLLGCPQYQPPQVRWWGIWDGQRFAHAPNARFADAGAAGAGMEAAHALVVTGAVGAGDGVYRPDGTFNGKARYVHESDPRQEILWIQIGGTAWHITTDREQPTDGAWTYQSEGNPERPATHGWEVDHGRYLPTVELKAAEVEAEQPGQRPIGEPFAAPSLAEPTAADTTGGSSRGSPLDEGGWELYLVQDGYHKDQLRLGANWLGYGSPEGGAHKMAEAAFDAKGFTEVLAVGSDGSWAHVSRHDGGSVPASDAFKVGAAHGYKLRFSNGHEQSSPGNDPWGAQGNHGPFFVDVATVGRVESGQFMWCDAEFDPRRPRMGKILGTKGACFADEQGGYEWKWYGRSTVGGPTEARAAAAEVAAEAAAKAAAEAAAEAVGEAEERAEGIVSVEDLYRAADRRHPGIDTSGADLPRTEFLAGTPPNSYYRTIDAYEYYISTRRVIMGLSSAEAAAALEKFGRNEMAEEEDAREVPVKRDGKFIPVEVGLLVPGDVIFVRRHEGVVPADAEWLEGDELVVDEAAVTGEPLAAVAVPREDFEGAPRSGKKLWCGAVIKTGECAALVTATGRNTRKFHGPRTSTGAGAAPVVMGTAVGAASAPPLVEMVNVLKSQLGLAGTISEVVERACQELGVNTEGMNLNQKATECWMMLSGGAAEV